MDPYQIRWPSVTAMLIINGIRLMLFNTLKIINPELFVKYELWSEPTSILDFIFDSKSLLRKLVKLNRQLVAKQLPPKCDF